MQNKNVTIILASNNEAKISSTQNICSSLFPNFTLSHHIVSSGVSETPETDDEAIKGCYTRIDNLESDINYHVDYIIALEGLTEKTSFGSFVYGWAVIKDTKKNKYHYGCSGKVMLPEDVMEKLSKYIRLSDVVLNLYPHISKADMDRLGTNGVLTNGLYTRVHEFETALKCAFGSLALEKGKMGD
ncbi:inosine/xanthosine triphosphatase [Pectobacterium sp. A5351]|uniref:inosine/xanthosine triphosphatase n=1 Tax=Pectobacterium sp. A5351 TaxID=2914983 RepID=UPI00232F7D97|nr:inosine/xanthosine triphosphatase [Pectobacterium sp. A5351]WCG82849.1 inosine/xanthosine triphosphatase [Pectobacterium sp. A5351]